MKLRDAPWKKTMTNLDSIFKKQRHHFANKGPYNSSYGFSRGHVQLWELVHNEGWALNNWYFWTVVLKKTLQSSSDCKEVKPVNPKGNESWWFIGRTDAEAGAPVFWQPDMKSQIIGKAPDPGKNWRQMKKREAEDEMVRCHHRLHVHKFVQTPGNSEGQGSLVCCSPWSHKELDMT